MTTSWDIAACLYCELQNRHQPAREAFRKTMEKYGCPRFVEQQEKDRG